MTALQFGLMSPEEVQKLSVAEISSTQPYDENRMPLFSGVNDPRLGTISRDFKCVTCKGSMEECPGHFGHISLAKRVYHVGLLSYLLKTLRCICFNCSRLLVPKESAAFQVLQKIKSSRRLKYAFRECSRLPGTVCDQQNGGCGFQQPRMSIHGLGISVEQVDENFDATKDRKQTLPADNAYQILRRISDSDLSLLGFDKSHGRPEWMLIKELLVAPPTVRPSVQMPNCMRSEDDLTYAYQQILKANS